MKFFCVSDIHGYYDPLIVALNEAGFEPDNPDHTLIACGDHFDRGRQPKEVLGFLIQLPRKVLIWGNHDKLLLESCNRGFFYGHDENNGTLGTVRDLSEDFAQQYKIKHGDYPEVELRCQEVLRIVQPFYQQHVDYFETNRYIFVHSFVPLNCLDDLPMYYTRGKVFEKMDNWRNAHYREWEAARWGNPFDLAKRGLLPDKTLVFGHWHTSWPRHHWGWDDEVGPEWGPDADFSPYYGKGFVGIDACTAHSGKVNVVVIEDTPMMENSEFS